MKIQYLFTASVFTHTLRGDWRWGGDFSMFSEAPTQYFQETTVPKITLPLSLYDASLVPCAPVKKWHIKEYIVVIIINWLILPKILPRLAY